MSMKNRRAEKKLSVGVVTRDGDEKFYRLWESLKPLKKVLREVVVLADPGSFREKSRLKELPLKVFRAPWRGFPQQKNKLLSLCRGEWILILDADERLTPDAVLQVQDIVCQDKAPFSVYRIARRNFFAGRLVFSWRSDEHIRLFRKGSGVFEEQHPVHECFRTALPCGRLTAALEHDSYDSVEHFLEKSNRYTTLEALLPRAEKYRRFFDYYLIVDPWVTVWRIFFMRGEWRCGWFGFQIAVLTAFYRWLRALKAWEKKR